ncbi:hypothetical protein WMY93_004876 [Mugilogobius chulae]|uniref:SCP domain-containing protein n=1 Tax=Mugilogobius chulae TaxID=88201 RepID=A0AAW0Q4U2_9GOBI
MSDCSCENLLLGAWSGGRYTYIQYTRCSFHWVYDGLMNTQSFRSAFRSLKEATGAKKSVFYMRELKAEREEREREREKRERERERAALDKKTLLENCLIQERKSRLITHQEREKRLQLLLLCHSPPLHLQLLLLFTSSSSSSPPAPPLHLQLLLLFTFSSSSSPPAPPLHLQLLLFTSSSSSSSPPAPPLHLQLLLLFTSSSSSSPPAPPLHLQLLLFTSSSSSSPPAPPLHLQLLLFTFTEMLLKQDAGHSPGTLHFCFSSCRIKTRADTMAEREREKRKRETEIEREEGEREREREREREKREREKRERRKEREKREREKREREKREREKRERRKEREKRERQRERREREKRGRERRGRERRGRERDGERERGEREKKRERVYFILVWSSLVQRDRTGQRCFLPEPLPKPFPNLTHHRPSRLDQTRLLSIYHFGCSSPSLDLNQSFRDVFLDTHNKYRAQHGVEPLRYNDEMCAVAQKWADHLLQQNTFMHSETKDGENIYNSFASPPVTPKGNEAVDSWYSEVKDYKYSAPGFGMNTGHFTQVVWKDSKELGVGLASSGGKVFVVGQYRPAGNMNAPGYFEKNVLPKGQCYERNVTEQ